jgi:enoyl-CoA hydratase
MQTEIRLEHSEHAAVIVLTPPPGKPPTLDYASLAALENAVGQIAARPPAAVIVRSAEPKYFCVGANLNVLKDTNADTIVPWVMLGHRVFNQLEDLPMPVIAQVDGYAMGGGLELALACDLIFAGAGARFAQSEAGLGFIPGWGGTRRLAERVGAATAKRIFFSGQMLDADAARQVGLADGVVPAAELDRTVSDFVAAVAKNSRYAIGTFKRIVNSEQRAARERNAAREALDSRGCLLDPGTQQRLADFLSKRK